MGHWPNPAPKQGTVWLRAQGVGHGVFPLWEVPTMIPPREDCLAQERFPCGPRGEDLGGLPPMWKGEVTP